MIREATGSDSARCAEIYRPYVEETTISFELDAPGTSEIARRIDSAHLWLVDETDEAIRGYAYAGPHRSRAAYDRTCEVSVYVDQGLHHRGIGRGLYAALFDRLLEDGFHMAIAGITLPNEASVALHGGLGFESVGTFREVGLKYEAWHDVSFWQLPLGDRRWRRDPAQSHS